VHAADEPAIGRPRAGCDGSHPLRFAAVIR
jgi:hypothetical protein